MCVWFFFYLGGSDLKLIGIGEPFQDDAADVGADGLLAAGQILALAPRQQAAVAFEELREAHAHRVARLADADRLQHARIAQLFQHHRQIEAHRQLVPVGFEAANKPRIAPGNGGNVNVSDGS